MVKDWVQLVAAVLSLQLAACGGNSSGPAPAQASEAGVTDGGALEGDAFGSGASEDAADDGPLDATGDDHGGRQTDAPTTHVSHVPLLHRASAVACTQPRPAGMLNAKVQ
jgi:hypothetical protein